MYSATSPMSPETPIFVAGHRGLVKRDAGRQRRIAAGRQPRPGLARSAVLRQAGKIFEHGGHEIPMASVVG